MSSAFDFYFYISLGSALLCCLRRASLFPTCLTKLPELNLFGYDPGPVTVARKKIILTGSYVHTWTESRGVTQGKMFP